MMDFHESDTPNVTKKGWQCWGDVYRHYLSKGYDNGYAAWRATEWETGQQRPDKRPGMIPDLMETEGLKR